MARIYMHSTDNSVHVTPHPECSKMKTVFLVSVMVVMMVAGSWDSYIVNLIAQSKDASGTAHVDRAAIIGLDGGAAWTSSSGANALKFQGQEAANIAKCFKSKDFTPFMAGGCHVEGVKYQFLRVEDDKVVFCKKKYEGALTMQASTSAIVIGHCPEGGQQGNTNKAVGVIAEYLESLGM